MRNFLMACRKVKRLFAPLLLLLLIELLGGYTLWKAGLRYRFIEVPSLQEIRFSPSEPIEQFEVRLANQAWTASRDPWERYSGALHWTMNQVQKIERNRSTRDPEILLDAVRKGAGGLCDDMAVLYTSSLSVVGLASRTIWLYTDVLGGNTHSTVEVFLENKWVVMDPTFGVYYRDADGTMLSAQEISAKLFQGSYEDIEPVFVAGDDVSYPARLDTYLYEFSALV